MTGPFEDRHADTIATTTAFTFTTMYAVRGIVPPFFVGDSSGAGERGRAGFRNCRWHRRAGVFFRGQLAFDQVAEVCSRDQHAPVAAAAHVDTAAARVHRADVQRELARP